MLSRFSRFRTLASFPALGLLGLALTGCGAALNPTAPSANSFVTAGTMHGGLKGGNQPISGSTIQLFAAGTTGYGSAGTLFATTTSASDVYGSFSFTQTTPSQPVSGPIAPTTSTYACPTGSSTNPDPQMYLVASGGETQGVGNGSNPAAVFVVALGKCSTVSSLFVDINEVTAVASMTALQQYFNPVTQSLGYPASAQGTLGFANGVAMISNLVTLSTGSTLASHDVTSTPAGATNTVTVTVTPEASKINLLANILAACVNSTTNTSTTCNTLFTNAVAPSASVTSQPSADYSSITASNETTAQALYFLLTNPTSGNSPTRMNALFNLPSSYSPFQPAYSTAPTDWTVAVSYASTSTCTFSTGNGSASTGKFLVGVAGPAIDASGNMWGASASTTTGTGGLFGVSVTGTPVGCGLGSMILGGITPVIDEAGYVWASSATKATSYHLYKWNAAGGTLDSSWSTSTTAIPAVLAVDGHSNVFYADTTNTSTYSTTAGSLNQFAGAAIAGATQGSSTPVKLATLYAAPTYMAIDSNDRVWVANTAQGTGTTQATQAFFDVYPSNNTGGSTYMAGTSDGAHTGYESTNVAGSSIYNPYGAAVGANGVIYTGNGAGSGAAGNSYRWGIITPGSTDGTVTVQNTAVNVAGIYSTRGVAVDGASNVWEANNNAATGNWVTGATSSGLYSVCEISSTGAPLSATSATGTGAYGVSTGGFQKPSTFLSIGARGVAIDPTGNVWVGQNGGSAPNVMVIVGAGVPVQTPIASAISAGTLGQKP